MADPRTSYFRRLRKLRRSARRWSVLAGGLSGAAAILTPYQGLGLPDAAWMAAAGASVVLGLWRWSDLRALAAQPAPPALERGVAADRARARLVAAVEWFPVGRNAVAEVRRQRARAALRGCAAAEPWARLDRASLAMAGFADRLTGPAAPAWAEAVAAEQSLRELAHRTASVEKALRFAPDDARPALESAHQGLLEQLDGGVTAYERLVGAAAGYLAEEGRSDDEHPAVSRLTEASDLLRGVAAGLAELRSVGNPPPQARY